MFEDKIPSKESVKQYEDTLKSVNMMNGEDAKAFLKQVYARLDIVQNGNGEYKSEQCVRDLISKFQDLTKITLKNNREQN
ncbi:hypothetical protein [Lentibacillus salicampi]|uniref:Uncharacterized protein n=1 Tax=Lentibacillus salicampi TaxID=175306 RepID=A0A4Y9ADW7_9BACI|nr:hypothetical protein [Lentibacillus salicampi]TFJ93140.1 hypothetical protein E4U82_08715 [Lentibacillus salicampi]